jgi:glycosyltransferase involved in cell wall biosynthesis
MVRTFGRCVPPGWRYALAGTLGRSAEDQSYFDAVRRESATLPVALKPNLGRGELLDLYGKAKIFWHAAGYANTAGDPELNEHFGITTVEAMSAGCVPVVFNRGGPSEIVEHGVNGFLWNTLDELRDHTTRLTTDEALWAAMSAAARRRAADFDRAHFVAGIARHLNLEPKTARGSTIYTQQASESRDMSVARNARS